MSEKDVGNIYQAIVERILSLEEIVFQQANYFTGHILDAGQPVLVVRDLIPYEEVVEKIGTDKFGVGFDVVFNIGNNQHPTTSQDRKIDGTLYFDPYNKIPQIEQLTWTVNYFRHGSMYKLYNTYPLFQRILALLDQVLMPRPVFLMLSESTSGHSWKVTTTRSATAHPNTQQKQGEKQKQ